MTKGHKISALHQDVSDRLTELKIGHRKEVLVEEGTASVDIAFEFGSELRGGGCSRLPWKSKGPATIPSTPCSPPAQPG